METYKEQPLLEIEIKDFITKVKTSNARRPIYYEKNGAIQVPDSKIKHLGVKYEWKSHLIGSKTKVLLTDVKTGEAILKNPRTAGVAKYIQINGNHFYAGFDSYHTRIQIIDAIKNNFREYFKGKKIKDFPIRLEWIIHNELVVKLSKGKTKSQDGDNMFYPYTKSGQDLMKQMLVIPDDDLQYIRKSSWEFIDSKEKKIIIKAYKYHPDAI